MRKEPPECSPRVQSADGLVVLTPATRKLPSVTALALRSDLAATQLHRWACCSGRLALLLLCCFCQGLAQTYLLLDGELCCVPPSAGLCVRSQGGHACPSGLCRPSWPRGRCRACLLLTSCASFGMGDCSRSYDCTYRISLGLLSSVISVWLPEEETSASRPCCCVGG